MVTDTVLVRGDVETEPGVILVTSLRMAARSNLVAGRAGLVAAEGSPGLVVKRATFFVDEGVVVDVLVEVILLRPVIVLEEGEETFEVPRPIRAGRRADDPEVGIKKGIPGSLEAFQRLYLLGRLGLRLAA